MMQLGQFSAWVTIDGTERETYSLQLSPDGRCITCWIASEEGKKFSVNWSNAFRDIAIQGVVGIDGVVCGQHVMLDAYNFPHKQNSIGVSYARTSDYTRRDFEFSAIQVTDDDSYLDTLGNTLQFGIIQLELWRLRVTDVVSQPLQHQYGSPVLESQILHERSKKAGTHHVKFGEEYVSPPPTVDVVNGTKIDAVPVATFIFKYRPIAMLQANGIAPRANQLPMEPVKREDSTATLEEIRNLEARLQALRSGAGSSNTNMGTSSRRRVKMEPVPHRGNILGPEVIDLT